MMLSERLKDETRAAHEAIEVAFDLDAHLASLASYRGLLQRLLGIHAAFEAVARPYLEGTGFEDRLCRADRLQHDLAMLGESGDALPPGSSTALAFVEGTPEAIGALYVVEGSTMGGLLIAREVEHRLGLGPETGAGFLSGHGRDSAAAWRAFRSRLDQLGHPESDTRVVAAALAMFAAMQTWLSRSALERAA